MSNPVVSIIIPTYNRSKLLQERALQSVFKQTYKDFECIVVDDAGTDDTEEIIKKYPVRYLKLPKNSGSAVAKREALKTAKGKYIVFLDDDNELGALFLEETVETLDRNPNYAAVQVGRDVFHRTSDGIPYAQYAAPQTSANFPVSMDWGWLIKREVFDEITWDSNCGPDEDMDFGIQFWLKGYHSLALDSCLSFAYGYSDDPKDSQSYPTEKRLKCLLYFMNKYKDLYNRFPNEQRYVYRLAGRNFYQAGHRIRGVWYFWLSFMALPNWKTFKHFLAILLGWNFYNDYMTKEEMKHA